MMRYFYHCVATVILLLVGYTAEAQERPTGKIEITAAIVLPELQIRPVPLLELELVSMRDTLLRSTARTALDGKAVQELAAGTYLIRTPVPTTVEGKSYQWSVVATVVAGRATTIELTNANAQVLEAAPPVLSRQMAPERFVFEKVKGAVFRVEAGLGHGTGFLADTFGGIVVTNDHVVADARTVSVHIDSVTRVAAAVIARDREADLALLKLPAGRCGSCPRLRLAKGTSTSLVTPGERILAIGFPLNQEMTLTSGIASSVRDGVVISDVNINPGNSGGPLINMAGEVIAVNTFGDFDVRGPGPGLSGSVLVTRLAPLLARATSGLDDIAAPDTATLPTIPSERYPAALLKSLADTATLKSYEHFQGRSAGPFFVSLSTPVLQAVRKKQFEREVGADRGRRESRAGLSDEERYSEMKAVRDWEEFVGAETAPVVTVSIVPKIGETGASQFGRSLSVALIGVAGQATLKFQGDVRGARFYRNGLEVHALRGGHGPQQQYVQNQWVALKDVADLGFYVLPIEAFEPDSTGEPPVVTVVVQDLKSPKNLAWVNFWGATSARVWNDFVPFLESQEPGRSRVRADPKRGKSRLPLDCNAETGSCVFRR